MIPDPELRPTGYPDAALIAALHGECFGGEPWDGAAVAGILSMPGTFGYLLLDNEEPAGFVLGRVAADECEILLLGVRPERRRCGFARRLLEAALERAAAVGGRIAHLEVSEANLAGRRLYRGQKFRERGKRPGYYAGAVGPAATAVLLSRRLPRSGDGLGGPVLTGVIRRFVWYGGPPLKHDLIDRGLALKLLGIFI